MEVLNNFHAYLLEWWYTINEKISNWANLLTYVSLFLLQFGMFYLNFVTSVKYRTALAALLFFASITGSVAYFSSTKQYQLLHSGITDPRKLSRIKRISVSDGRQGTIQMPVIYLWAPSKFTEMLYIYFSPFHVVVGFLLVFYHQDESAIILLLILYCGLSIILNYQKIHYTRYILDKEILLTELSNTEGFFNNQDSKRISISTDTSTYSGPTGAYRTPSTSTGGVPYSAHRTASSHMPTSTGGSPQSAAYRTTSSHMPTSTGGSQSAAYRTSSTSTGASSQSAYRTSSSHTPYTGY